MPFLTSPDVLPEAMRFIVRVLLRSEDPIPQSDLLRLIAPAGLVEAVNGTGPDSDDKFSPTGQIIADKTLAEMRGAGIVDQATTGTRAVTASSIVTDAFPSWDAVHADVFADFLRTAVVAAASDVLDEDAGGGAEDLAHAIALLFLMPGPLTPIAAFEEGKGKSLAEFQTRHLGDDIAKWVVRGPVRYPQLVRWASYLGYARLDNKGRLLIDPSVALHGPVSAIVQDEMDLPTFIDRLGIAVPPTDRGRIGSAVREKLSADQTRNGLSPGVALGLVTLHHQGVIKLTDQDDAESLSFPVVESEILDYTHIAPGPKK
jgi:hypothetical protein